MLQRIVAILILTITMTFSLGLAKAQSDLKVATPKINPVEGAGGQIYLPGANSGSNQGQLLQKSLLPQVTTLVIGITGALAFLFVIVGGIQILVAYGNEEMLTAGKKTITWALAGLVISILSFAIVQIITSINFNSSGNQSTQQQQK